MHLVRKHHLKEIFYTTSMAYMSISPMLSPCSCPWVQRSLACQVDGISSVDFHKIYLAGIVEIRGDAIIVDGVLNTWTGFMV